MYKRTHRDIDFISITRLQRENIHHNTGSHQDSAMKLQILLLFFFHNCMNQELNNTHIRHKRAILDLAEMIECGTGLSPLAYVGYGCYCGIGGKGSPKDKADWCCHKHDCCYGIAEQHGCLPKSDFYDWSCTDDAYIKCGNTNDHCQRILCYCDKQLAECLRKAPYNNKYILYPNFLCGSKTPSCYYREWYQNRRKQARAG
ncbi:group 10 secretory phospholipase A2 [Rana temporaria]|uniref:group 10 secretory phospholipase A2 n=1 Tax=Rana temporaria TaxID=8407 RepID=UPI001AAD9522|nr:group 10 secretory phospholipase A2 [Rana temporaria]